MYNNPLYSHSTHGLDIYKHNIWYQTINYFNSFRIIWRMHRRCSRQLWGRDAHLQLHYCSTLVLRSMIECHSCLHSNISKSARYLKVSRIKHKIWHYLNISINKNRNWREISVVHPFKMELLIRRELGIEIEVHEARVGMGVRSILILLYQCDSIYINVKRIGSN